MLCTNSKTLDTFCAMVLSLYVDLIFLLRLLFPKFNHLMYLCVSTSNSSGDRVFNSHLILSFTPSILFRGNEFELFKTF